MENENEDILNSMPDEFRVVETGISYDIHIEFLNISEKVTNCEYNDNSIDPIIEELFNNKTKIIRIKEIIVILGNIGTIKSLKILKEYYDQSTDDLKGLLTLAMQENMMFLDNEFGDNNIGMISSGLGGKDNRLRIYVVFISLSEEPYTDFQKKLIETEFKAICDNNDSELEKIDFNFDYAELTILMSHNVALDTIVLGGIRNCNVYGDFINEFYFATNQGIPSVEELHKIIKEELRD